MLTILTDDDALGNYVIEEVKILGEGKPFRTIRKQSGMSKEVVG